MANISTYPIGTPAQGDLIPGTQKYTNANGKTENLTRNFTVANIAAFANSYSLGYTVYSALITQAGAAAPVATVLQNTTGQTIAWTRPAGVGRYVATISNNAYTANKTAVIITSGGNNDRFLKPVVSSTSTVDIYNIDTGDSAVSDGISATTTVEIRIYS
tara:strand:- start:33 stop:512 length:480 start_codon:yes stop_codon:yes gene_type:complete